MQNFREPTGFGVTLETQHDLWSTIPPSGNILGHVPSILLRIRRESSCKTEVADFEFTIGINEQIPWLQISMQDICRMDVFQPTQDLIDEGLEVSVR